MSFNKSWFKQNEGNKEGEKYEAKSEKKKVDMPKCKHRDIEMKRNTIICSCGAFWTGPGIDKLYKNLKSGRM